jgi:hypothetical protein
VAWKSGSRAKAFDRMGKKNADADQDQNRSDCFIHDTCPFRPGSDKTTTALHSQKESCGETKFRP